MAKAKYEVAHERQYFLVADKMQKVAKGTVIELDEKDAEKLGDRVFKAGGKPSAKVGAKSAAEAKPAVGNQ